METKHEIYPDRNKRLEQENKKLEGADLSEINKEMIRNFQNYISSTGSGQQRIAKLSYQLRNIAVLLKKDFDKATKQDILEVIAYYNKREDISEATKADYRRGLKQFYKWYKEEDERIDSNDQDIRIRSKKFYKYLEKEVSISYKKSQIDPTTILTEEDIEQIVSKGCRTPKEKAFLKFLHETGVRAGEMLGLKIKDIEIKKNIGVAHVDGKTGRRVVQFTKSMGYIVQWINFHPFKDDAHSFLWLGERANKMHQPLIHRGAQKLIDRCFERANNYIKEKEKRINKKHNLHWFRHSRASLLAPHLPEILLCKYMGWIIGSKQVKTYCHLCPQQLEEAFLKINGLEEEKKKENLPKRCGCGVVNDSFARYCLQCGNPLNIEIALQDQEIIKTETGKAIREMMELFKNPELLEKFQKFKESWDNSKS